MSVRFEDVTSMRVSDHCNMHELRAGDRSVLAYLCGGNGCKVGDVGVLGSGTGKLACNGNHCQIGTGMLTYGIFPELTVTVPLKDFGAAASAGQCIW